MKRLFTHPLAAGLGVAISLIGLGPSSAWATSGAHFMHDTSASVDTNGALSISIDEAGVGQATIQYRVDWSVTADYGCVNGGGNHPRAANKQTTSTGGQASFSESPTNGRVKTTVDPVPNTPPSVTGFSCPGGQKLVLADISYSFTLTDSVNNASIDLSASATFVTFKK